MCAAEAGEKEGGRRRGGEEMTAERQARRRGGEMPTADEKDGRPHVPIMFAKEVAEVFAGHLRGVGPLPAECRLDGASDWFLFAGLRWFNVLRHGGLCPLIAAPV